MKRPAFIFTFIFIFTSVIHAQEVIENPENPLSKNSGRKAELIEVMKIRDVGSDFYFMFPHNLKVAPDESVFIVDKDQLLNFDRSGKFVRNLFKRGQGPGEMGHISNYCFFNNNIIIYNSYPPKMMWFDLRGSLTKELKVQTEGLSLEFLTLYEGTYYFFNSDYPSVKRGQSVTVDVPQNLIAITHDGEEMERLASFPTKVFIAASKQGGQAMCPINSLITVSLQEKFVFICHTQEYLVKLYDLEKQQVVRQFRRKYKRIKTPQGEEKKCGASVDGKEVILPHQKYVDDIQNLFISGDRLWVMTSTIDEEKRVLIDVFNFEGQYIDNFYLKFPDNLARDSFGYKPMIVSGSFLYAVEQDEDGTYAISKHKIEDNNKPPRNQIP
jgi:hypothetical protein